MRKKEGQKSRSTIPLSRSVFTYGSCTLERIRRLDTVGIVQYNLWNVIQKWEVEVEGGSGIGTGSEMWSW